MASLLERKRELVVDRGPDWLFVRLDLGFCEVDSVADHLWAILNKHFIYRIVLEMEDVEMLSSRLMGQLVMLQKRVLQHDGALRLSGLAPACEQALKLCRLDRVLPNYHCRVDAVHCQWPSKPR